MVRLVPRQRIARIVLSLSGSHSRPTCRLADKTWRLASDRRAWKGIIKFPDLDADLRRDRRDSLHLPDRNPNLDSALGGKHRAGHHRIG